MILHKNINLLKNFVTDQGKILPKCNPQISIKQHRKISKAIKRARTLKLFPKFPLDYSYLE